MTYKVFVTHEVQEIISLIDKKTSNMLIKNLKKLEENPYPGKGIGDKEKLPVSGKMRYRMHIGRTWAVFYSILEEKKQVRVAEILPIDEAHKKYVF